MGTQHQKPDLSRWSSREIFVNKSVDYFKASLAEWMADVVQQTENPFGNPFARAAQLVLHATGVDVILHAPVPLNLSGQRRVFARFLWGRTWNADWYIRAVAFSIILSNRDLQEAERAALKERLLDKAEQEFAKRYHPRPYVFPAENRVDSFAHDLENGNAIVASFIERAYQHGREVAQLLENPITPLDLAVDAAGFGVGKAGKVGDRAAKLAKTYEGVDAGKKVLDTNRRAQEAVSGKKTTGDAILETAVDMAGLIPGAGPFINVIAGFIFEVAIANQAGLVTRLRSRAYTFLIAGFINEITNIDSGGPVSRIDRGYMMFGRMLAMQLNATHRYQVQLSLLHYASNHYTAGGWGGLVYLGYRKGAWLFPDQYVVNWSPRLIAAALATQLHKIKYLVH
jgi:hypothetical protein